jgi:hypothetical protein
MDAAQIVCHSRGGSANASSLSGMVRRGDPRARVLFFVTTISISKIDYSQGYHRPWLQDCPATEQCEERGGPGWKTEQCEERRGDPSRGSGTHRVARDRLEDGWLV